MTEDVETFSIPTTQRPLAPAGPHVCLQELKSCWWPGCSWGDRAGASGGGRKEIVPSNCAESLLQTAAERGAEDAKSQDSGQEDPGLVGSIFPNASAPGGLLSPVLFFFFLVHQEGGAQQPRSWPHLGPKVTSVAWASGLVLASCVVLGKESNVSLRLKWAIISQV